MVRIIGFLAGLVFVVTLAVSALMPREDVVPDPNHHLHKHPEQVAWSWEGAMGLGVFGTYDRAQLQRGFQVYKEVCAACHGLNRVAFRNLTEIGFSEAEVKALAKAVEVPSIDDKTGEPSTRPGIPSDKMPSPYANEIAARAANNNAVPPDLSLITKARHDGSNYLFSLLTGYQEAPKGFEVGAGLHYNPYFHSLAIAMPAPLASDGQVTYADGQPQPTVKQMAQDVTAFLTWAGEPKLEERKQTGLKVILFLLLMTSFAYISYRKVWASLKGH